MSGEFDRVMQLWAEAGQQIDRWWDVIFAAAGVYGVFLCFFGARLVRPSLTLVGVIFGGALGLLLPTEWFGGLRIGAVIVPGVVMGFIFFLSYRFWVAMVLALALGVVMPWGLLVYQQQMTWDGKEIAQESVEGAAASGRDVGVKSLAGGDEVTEAAREAAGEVARKLDETLRELIMAVNDWFWAISPAIRWTVIVLGVIGTVGGLSIGLALPTLGAAMMTSFAGSMLLSIALYRLQGSVLGFMEGAIPDAPGAYLMIVVVLTCVGTLIQYGWTRFSKDDE